MTCGREKVLEALKRNGPMTVRQLVIEVFGAWDVYRKNHVAIWLKKDEKFGIVKVVDTKMVRGHVTNIWGLA